MAAVSRRIAADIKSLAWVFIAACTVHAAAVHATTFHVAQGGSDAASGSEALPWRSIQHCADQAQPGDVCRVHSGVYRETVSPPRSGTPGAPIRFEAAPGECVTVSGADVLAGSWTPFSGAIWVTPTTKQFVQLFSNGSLLNEARWPNAEPADLVHMPMARAGPGTDMNGLIASGAPAGDWTGAMVFVLPGSQWWSYTRHITAEDQASQRLSFDKPISDASLVPVENSRYYLFGSLLALDSEGEWFLDTTAGRLYFWPPGGASPGGLSLEIKQRTWTFDVTNRAYIEIAGFQTSAGGIRLNSSNHCTVDGVRAKYVSAMRETNGWTLNPDVPSISGDFNVWKNGVFAGSAASGLFIAGNDNLIENNIFHDIDTVALQRAGVEFATWLANARNVIAYNTIFRTGWAGIGMTGASQSRALFNRISDSALLVNDAGSIYAGQTDGQNSEIAWNEISGAPCDYCAGVYLDDSTRNFVVHHNYLHDLGWFGVSFKDRNAIFNNTILAVGHSPLAMGQNVYTGTFDAARGAVVLNNLLDTATEIAFGLHPTTVADATEFFAPVRATPDWQHVVLPFASMSMGLSVTLAPRDLAVAQRLQFHVETPGDFRFEVDNVRLEGATPKLLSDFESGLTTTTGSAWWAGGANGSTSSLQRIGFGVACSAGAAELSGTQRVYGYNGLGVNLPQSQTGAMDLTGYTGISFDIRARSQFWTTTFFQSATPIGPVQGLNYACPIDSDGVPTGGCGQGEAEAIPGFVSAGSDMGAFQSGQQPWRTGAVVVESPPSCVASTDSSPTLPAAMPYPVTPTGTWPAPPLRPQWIDTRCHRPVSGPPGGFPVVKRP